ncbi:MAG: DUF642 domain-containing protein [Gammaproteobacteria bacterium]|nr:DUF642 domain-containing protein [Gammaproteobacteria bacterium]
MTISVPARMAAWFRCITLITSLILAAAPASARENALQKLGKALNALGNGQHSGNLIVNGSFEEPVVGKGRYLTFPAGQSFAGWQVIGSGSVSPISGEYVASRITFNAQQGSQWLDMTGPGSNSAAGVQQTVRTQPGTRYELVFYVGNVVGGSFGTTSSIEVLVDGKSLGVSRNASNSPGGQSWGQVKLPITATGNSTTIAFINRDPSNDNSNGLDNVSLMPAPATAVLTESFEAPVTSNYTTYNAGQSFRTATNTWTVAASGVDICNVQARREVTAFEGNQTLDLNGSPGAGVLATSFATKAGQKYSLSFHYARNNGLGATPARAKVEVLGSTPLLQAEIRHDKTVGPFGSYLIFSDDFVADGTTASLRFTSLNSGNAGITLDAIEIKAVD